MAQYEHKIEWLPQTHTVIDGYEDISNYWMFLEYKELIESGEQHVSEDIHQLFVYLYNTVFHLDIYLDVTATEKAYNTPKKYYQLFLDYASKATIH